MFSSQTKKSDFLLSIYQDMRTVFRLRDIAMLTGITNFQALNQKLNYHVSTGKLKNPRRGIYVKSNYDLEELACTIYAPSYISLEYILQKSGIIFQYDSRITSMSYLSRIIEVENRSFIFRKLKGELLVNTSGIIRQSNQVNRATPERAFLDTLYLTPEFYFDNLNPLNKELVYKLLPLYQSNAITKRVNKLLQNNGYKPT